jgi:membrane protease subunit HflC
MEAERKQEANRLRATGAAEGERIRAQADRERQELLAKAYAQAQQIKGEGDATAAALYATAYGKNPAFYSLYKSLDSYRTAFSSSNDTLVLSPKSEFFRFWNSAEGKQPATP